MAPNAQNRFKDNIGHRANIGPTLFPVHCVDNTADTTRAHASMLGIDVTQAKGSPKRCLACAAPRLTI